MKEILDLTFNDIRSISIHYEKIIIIAYPFYTIKGSRESGMEEETLDGRR